ncbi:hypothetical protein OH460_08965 [Vibrio sp. Makdt]|uniref:hypothetical protein n=1 Tax=Vibrio sp. Makdt TaxID=2998828 RepID=UPI0022CDAA27|nr:hypothetical protein [Vibrio sp. Makdt]MDA0152432.1 hypothetical protein [Vibrio sp. Makdt]
MEKITGIAFSSYLLSEEDLLALECSTQTSNRILSRDSGHFFTLSLFNCSCCEDVDTHLQSELSLAFGDLVVPRLSNNFRQAVKLALVTNSNLVEFDQDVPVPEREVQVNTENGSFTFIFDVDG